MSYQDHVDRLAPIEALDPAAFLGDEDAPQSVCDFVVALALAFNDLRDHAMAMELLKNLEGDQGSLTTATGLKSGALAAVQRSMAGATHELLKLLNRSGAVLNEPSFKKLEAALSRRAKQSWKSLVRSAKGKPSRASLEKALLILRNKVAFHYDAAEIGKGYRKFFSDYEEALVSRGASAFETRFYFADAAAIDYVHRRCFGTEEAEQFLKGEASLHWNVIVALRELVTKWPATRGFGWREPAADLTPRVMSFEKE